MSGWNFDMDAAPKGNTVTVTRTVKDREVTYDKHIPELIIAAGNGGVVTLSRWLPDEGRWNMFTKATPPLAWQPWPAHPDAAE